MPYQISKQRNRSGGNGITGIYFPEHGSWDVGSFP